MFKERGGKYFGPVCQFSIHCILVSVTLPLSLYKFLIIEGTTNALFKTYPEEDLKCVSHISRLAQ